MSKQKLPIFGHPVFVITENTLTDKVQIASEGGYLNSLTYFAANGIMVNKIEYNDKFPGDTSKVVLNKGMKDINNPEKSLELSMDLSQDPSDAKAYTIFTDEADAQAVAKRLNENQKKNAKKLLDAAQKAFNSYDEIIALCKVN